MDERPDAPAVPPSPPLEPEKPKRMLAGFLVGIVVGFFGTWIVAGIALLIVLQAFGSHSKIAGWIVCVLEVVGFVALLLAAIKTKRRGLPQGVLTGGAVALLVCAACWGSFVGLRIGG